MRNAVLTGERLYLRPLESNDVDAMVRSAAQEPDTMMERLRLPYSPIAVEQRLLRDLHKQQPPPDVVFAVCLVEDDRFIGTVNLGDIDYVNRTAETGSWIDLPEYRGKGYGTEAKMLLLEYAFDRLHLHVLLSHVWELNTRSAAALAKQGYRPAGRYKWEDLKGGAYRDGLLFDVLRDDWLAARERWLQERASAGAGD